MLIIKCSGDKLAAILQQRNLHVRNTKAYFRRTVPISNPIFRHFPSSHNHITILNNCPCLKGTKDGDDDSF